MKEPTLETIERAIETATGFSVVKALLDLPGVVGVHPGIKQTGGVMLSEPAFVVHVRRKLPTGEIPPSERVPAFVWLPRVSDPGAPWHVPTDIVEVGDNRSQGVPAPETAPYRPRPCPGGIRIQATPRPGELVTGTIAITLMFRGRDRLMTNNHVVSWNGEGSPVYQPDEGACNDIAVVAGFFPVEPASTGAINRYDVAFCDTTPEKTTTTIWNPRDPDGPGISPSAVGQAARGDVVQLVASGLGVLQQAEVKSTHYAACYEWIPGVEAKFFPLVLLSSLVTQGGDSGTAYMTGDLALGPTLVGIHMGANAKHSFGCPFPPGSVVSPDHHI